MPASAAESVPTSTAAVVHDNSFDRVRKEIDELEANKRTEEALLKKQQDRIADGKESVAKLQGDLETLQNAEKPDDAAIQAATQKLEAARAQTMLEISQKDHTAYRLTILERSLRQHKARLTS